MNCVVLLLLEKIGYCNIHNQNGELLSNRDGMGVGDTETISVKAEENARVLLMEAPMSIQFKFYIISRKSKTALCHKKMDASKKVSQQYIDYIEETVQPTASSYGLQAYQVFD